jgi:aryl-alcohol dehydrogenase-like predicted oxidoreductase
MSTRSAGPGVTSVVIGARREQQLIDNLAAADLELSADDQARAPLRTFLGGMTTMCQVRLSWRSV